MKYLIPPKAALSILDSIIKASPSCLFLFYVFIIPSCTNQFSTPCPQMQTIRVMTFNIRLNNPLDGENAWPNRKELVTGLIGFHEADIIGMQEALNDQIADLDTLLQDFEWYGIGRTDGKESGEYAPIFYRKERFQRVQKGTFWLSESPESVGSKGWDAAIERIASWVELKDVCSAKNLFVFNAHFDHVGEIARQESAGLILGKISKIAKSAPVVLLGDFNCEENSVAYSILTGKNETKRSLDSGAELYNTRDISQSQHYGPGGTFTGFNNEAFPFRTIDYVFVNKQFHVTRHAVLTDHFDGRLPSDHRPVIAEIAFE